MIGSGAFSSLTGSIRLGVSAVCLADFNALVFSLKTKRIGHFMGSLADLLADLTLSYCTAQWPILESYDFLY